MFVKKARLPLPFCLWLPLQRFWRAQPRRIAQILQTSSTCTDKDAQPRFSILGFSWTPGLQQAANHKDESTTRLYADPQSSPATFAAMAGAAGMDILKDPVDPEI